MSSQPEGHDAPMPRAARPRPRRPRWKRLVLASCGLALALALAEGALHVAGVEIRAQRLVRDPILGVRNRPGWSGPVFSVNSRGFLGAEIDPRKAPGTIRVFCLGDSCTAGDLLPSFDQTYPRQLAVELARRHPGRAFEVVNAGVGGYSSFQGRTWLEREIAGLEPDVIVACFGWNDHWPARAAGPDKVVSGSASERLRSWLSWCKLLQLTIKGYHVLRGQRPMAATPTAGGATAVAAGQTLRVSREDYRANLAAVVDLMRDRGGATILVTAPNYLELAAAKGGAPVPDSLGDEQGVRALVALHADYNEIVRQVARDRGACLVDAAHELAAEPEPARLFWEPPSDFIHLSAEGYARLARAVAASACLQPPFRRN